ncbi:transposase [Cohnella zeiphila]|uniref:Transposase n=1 Tax=Cohnella zeiphila TaxID=2761120 RepID=A0A7X0SNY5_9BACL|nr:transposase [Cohnella zeiphila]MBB6733411.1 transposase [Cohnella zeiphila]
MPESSTEREPIIYHYKLIRKIGLRPESKYSAVATAVMGVAVVGIFYGLFGLLYAVAGLLLMLAVHAVVLKITLRRVDRPSERRWAFRYDLPWIGPLPVMDTNLSLFRRLHFHLFLVGCCVACLFYPWAPSSLVVSLFYWHFWLLAPRLSLLRRMRRDKGDGVIRLEATEVSYYHR